jgi:hypothetical protein
MPDDVGTLTELTNNLADDYYKNFDISGGSLQVTYRTDNGLFSIPVGGGTATQLINNYIGNYMINNDGTFVFYYDDASSLHSYSLNNDTDIVLFYTPLSDFKILNNSSGILFNNLDLLGLISFTGEDLFEISRFTWDFSLGDLTYGYQISTDETFLIFIDSFYDGSKWISSLVRFDL